MKTVFFAFASLLIASVSHAGAIEDRCVDKMLNKYENSDTIEIHVAESTPTLTYQWQTWEFSDADGNYTDFQCRLDKTGEDCTCK